VSASGDKARPQWSSEQLLVIIRYLTESSSGAITCVYTEMRRPVIDLFVQHNI